MILALRLLFNNIAQIERLQPAKLINGIEKKYYRLLPQDIHGNFQVPQARVVLQAEKEARKAHILVIDREDLKLFHGGVGH